MGRYRKIDVTLWDDARFRRLSPIPPCGQGLWLFLLTNPDTSNIPGCYRATEAGLAETLGWPLKAFREAFQEALREGLVQASWEDRLVYIPGGIAYDPPQSPNVVKSWKTTWSELPECELKLVAWQGLEGFLEGYGQPFVEAFREGCARPFVGGFPKGVTTELETPSPNPEPEPEPEQEPEPETKKSSAIRRVFDHWNICANGGPWHKHRRITPAISKAVERALKDYPVEEVCQAIDNYAMVLQGDEYFWTHVWTLQEFLTRRQGSGKGAFDPYKWWAFTSDEFDPEKFVKLETKRTAEQEAEWAAWRARMLEGVTDDNPRGNGSH